MGGWEGGGIRGWLWVWSMRDAGFCLFREYRKIILFEICISLYKLLSRYGESRRMGGICLEESRSFFSPSFLPSFLSPFCSA